MSSIAVFGLPHSGTSVLWDVLCQDPQYERYIYEPLRQNVMDGRRVHPSTAFAAFRDVLNTRWYGHSQRLPTLSSRGATRRRISS